MTTPYLRQKLIGNFRERTLLRFIYYLLLRISHTELLSKWFHSYKIKCENCGDAVEFTTDYRSIFKWEIKKNYYHRDKYLKTHKPDWRGYVGYYVEKERIKNDKILCEKCLE